MTKLLQQIIDKTLGGINEPCIKRSAINNIPVEHTVSIMFDTVQSKYLHKRLGTDGNYPQEKADKYNQELLEAEPVIRETVQERFLYWKRQRDISLIEFPVLQLKIARELYRRGIRYRFGNLDAQNSLTVHVVGEHFYIIPVTLDNVDRVLTYLSYCIKRPEYAQEEIPEIKRYSNWYYAKQWDSLSTTGDEFLQESL